MATENSARSVARACAGGARGESVRGGESKGKGRAEAGQKGQLQ